MQPIMFCGTGSDVGKSLLATAVCRILWQDGYHPAPFKAQNMSLNSFVTPDGLEIGRAQAVQAEAACAAMEADMNPVLLKPTGQCASQVVLNGRPAGNRSAYDYFRGTGRRQLWEAACRAFDRLAAKYDPIVMEGAGSISELNLRDNDIVNLPMARHARARVVLVADIDRGGVFASCYGSIALQTPADRKLIRGIVVNKFRGDMRLFDDGRQLLERICGVPVLGVVPYLDDIHIDGEDSVELERKDTRARPGAVNVGVVRVGQLSNFTDFDILERDPRLHLYYTNRPAELLKADIIILPGSKSTLADLAAIWRNGCAGAVLQARRQGKTIVGICGGFQMLGDEVSDPDRVEGGETLAKGLGLLPMTTVMTGEKTTRRVTSDGLGHPLRGYEIHNGRSLIGGQAPPRIVRSGRVFGTYVHGIFDNASFRDAVLAPYVGGNPPHDDAQAYREAQYNRLAEHVRRHVDIGKLVHL